jgi:hypothetical protein
MFQSATIDRVQWNLRRPGRSIMIAVSFSRFTIACESDVAHALSAPRQDFLDTSLCRMPPGVGRSAGAPRKVRASRSYLVLVPRKIWRALSSLSEIPHLFVLSCANLTRYQTPTNVSV